VYTIEAAHNLSYRPSPLARAGTAVLTASEVQLRPNRATPRARPREEGIQIS